MLPGKRGGGYIAKPPSSSFSSSSSSSFALGDIFGDVLNALKAEFQESGEAK